MAEQIIESDVLVIGGGLAGCWAAMRARAMGLRVVLADKAVLGYSGCTSMGGNFQLSPMPEEELDSWRRELVETGEFINDQVWVESLLREQGERFRELVSWGVPFERDEKGKILRRKGRGHKTTFMSYCDSQGLMKVLRSKVLESGTRLVERVMIIELLTADGQHPTQSPVVGAVGFHTRTGEFLIFRAKATVMTAGPMFGMKLPGYVAANCTGDAPMMAYRAGVELTGMEFCINGHPAFYDGRYLYGALDNLVQAAGAILVNSQGERFMERYDPVLMERAKWQVTCRAIAKENLEGRGPVYVDMTRFSQGDRQLLTKFRLNPPDRSYRETGFDPSKDRVPCVVRMRVASTSGQGGIKIDTHCQTNLPGLFAAGAACRNPAHGTYTVGGVNLAFCNVGGYRAGESAADYCQKASQPQMEGRQIERLKETALSPLNRKKGLSPDELFARMRDDIITPAGVSIFRNEKRLKAAIGQLDKLIGETLPQVWAKDVHQMVKASEAGNAALMAKLTLTGCLERKETRGWQYREEFPYQDDIDWLKWVILRRQGESGVAIRHETIPIESYPVQPKERRRLPAPVQYTFPKG